MQDNTTHAIVEDGAKIFSGADGGFNMKAEEAIFHIDLVQSGSTGGKFAIAGSVAYVGQTATPSSSSARRATSPAATCVCTPATS